MRTALLICVFFLALGCNRRPAEQPRVITATAPVKVNPPTPLTPVSNKASESHPTFVVVHNVIFHNQTPVKLKVKWLRGRMYATSPNQPPSFDDTKSFRFEIQDGLMGVNLSDLSGFLSQGPLKNSALRNVKVTPDNGRLKITGSLKKGITIPVQMIASLGVSPDQRHVRMHVEKLSTLKIPLKGFLGFIHVKVDDLFDPKGNRGIDVNGDNVDIDVNELLPAPKAEGLLTQVKVWKNGDLMEYYGEPREDAIKVKQWRNFVRMRGGTISFGKLTMHNADLLMVDTSMSDWFNFDVNHYQEQLVYGVTHITPQAGLQLFLPDINKLPKAARRRSVGVQWMKNRDIDPPPDFQ